MEKTVRNMIITALGSTMAIYMMAVPLSATVYAAEKPPVVANFEIDKHEHKNEVMHKIEGKHFKHDRLSIARQMEAYKFWLRKHNRERYQDPVAAVTAAAQSLGLDPNNNTFNVVNKTPSQALVQVTQSGSNDNVNITLQLTPTGTWTVSSMK